MFLPNVGWLSTDYAALFPRRESCSENRLYVLYSSVVDLSHNNCEDYFSLCCEQVHQAASCGRYQVGLASQTLRLEAEKQANKKQSGILLLGLLFDRKDGGSTFLRNIDELYQTTRRHIPEYCTYFLYSPPWKLGIWNTNQFHVDRLASVYVSNSLSQNFSLLSNLR
jgi:hypothetical protein